MRRDFYYDLIGTLKGNFAVVFSEQGIYEIIFPEEAVDLPWAKKKLPWPQLKEDLNRYLAGEDVDWSSYPLDHADYAPFTARLLQEMAKIPYGTVCTYREMAERAGSPRAWRAAGQACGANRHPVIVPWHRVVASGGGLGGFSAPEGWKEFLLKLEGVIG